MFSVKNACLVNTKFKSFAPKLPLVHFFSKKSGLPAAQTWRFEPPAGPKFLRKSAPEDVWDQNVSMFVLTRNENLALKINNSD